MKNIHVLPTDKPSILHIAFEKILILSVEPTSKSELYKSTPQNISITSDEEVKEGDYFIRDGSIHKCFRVHKTDIEFLTSIDSVYCGSNTFWSKEFCKKIILTTDLELQKDGVQPINDEFLEWFVKNPSCEEVEVNKEQYHQFVGMKKIPLIPNYKIIIPKEEVLLQSSIDGEVIWGEIEVFKKEYCPF